MTDQPEQHLDMVREEFEVWASDDWQWPQCVERAGNSYRLMQTKLKWEAYQAATQRSAARISELESGLAGIKSLLSRDPCAHANTAIKMIDAMKEKP